MVRQMAAGREGDEPLFVTSRGCRLPASAFKRALGWADLVEGRRIHDLRHTAACLWLARGVDPVTVQTWMGHASTRRWSALMRLTTGGTPGGTREERPVP